MSSETGIPQDLKIIINAEQIQMRICEIARQITSDYKGGKELHVVCVLENGAMFMADLVRNLDIPVVCHFLKPLLREKIQGSVTTTEIFFSPELEIAGQHVLIVEGLLNSGLTTEFVLRNLTARGAASVRLCVLLDRQTSRRIAVQPDYYGFLIDNSFVFGYGLGAPELGRNLGYIASTKVMQPSI